jgi:hypothetical protein
MTEPGDGEVLAKIKALVDEEHALGGDSPEERSARRREVEDELDQCWDLLRQRQARRDAGEDPGAAEVRPVSEVEGYLQ